MVSLGENFSCFCCATLYWPVLCVVLFKDYAVKSSWRHRHAAMTPLFATQASQSSAMDYEDSVDGQVRATQDVQQFTQTVEAG